MLQGFTTFIELSGPDARDRLRRHRETLTRRGVACALLAHEDESDRLLLVCRGRVPAEDAPQDARVWRFRAVEPETP